jgi:hypothetical protein
MNATHDANDSARQLGFYKTGEVAEPPRFAGRRAIPKSHIPQIVDALRERGWLPTCEDSPA